LSYSCQSNKGTLHVIIYRTAWHFLLESSTLTQHWVNCWNENVDCSCEWL